MRPINLMFFIMVIFNTNYTFSNSLVKNKDFIICYGKLNPKEVKGYNYVILEAQHYTREDITIFKNNNKSILAYISLGEVHPSVPYYKEMMPNTFGKNEIWGGNYLNLEKEETQKILIKAMGNLFDLGFDGVFLDNIDNFTIYGPMKDQADDLINFLKRIKQEFPSSFLMQNAGLSLLKDTSIYVNSLLIESVATAYDFENKKYKLRSKKDFIYRKEELERTTLQTNIPILIIEYVDSKKLCRKVKNRIKNKGWSYFFAKIDLQTLSNYN